MYGPFQKANGVLRGGAALLLALLLCTAPFGAGVTASAAGSESSARMLVPVGHTIGIKLFARGVLVVKLSDGGTPAKDCGLQTGDVIVKCGGVSVTSTEQFQTLLQENGGIRDSMAGIGTMTYYDPATGAFGALGHGITDVDTAQLMPFSSGSILPSTVKAVKKGASGAAGELRGDFDLTRDLGTLSANTASGVFGTVEESDFTESLTGALPVAKASEVRTGPAVILSNVEGDHVAEYDVEILQIVEGSADGRDLVISVTDPELIAATGGIVQGMSGSPILQNGKFVGAVTHVLLNDPTKGYGILMETMLKAGQAA